MATVYLARDVKHDRKVALKAYRRFFDRRFRVFRFAILVSLSARVAYGGFFVERIGGVPKEIKKWLVGGACRLEDDRA